MVREGRIFISVATDPDFGAGYFVTAYEVGAQVTGVWSAGAIPVRAGHGFATNDKFIVAGEFPLTTKMRTVTGTTATSISCASVTVAAADVLINLAADGETVAGTPNYDGNGLAVYTDMAYGSQATNNTVTCDSNGRFRYFHQSISIWELVRTSAGVPISFFLDAGIPAITGPSTTTDNAIVRWDGTTGETTQNSVVIATDAGAVSGITSLGMGGALSGVTTLVMSGGLSGVTTVAMGGALSGVTTLVMSSTLTGVTSVTMAGALTGVTTLNASGLVTCAAAVTVGTTLTTTGGIVGGIPRNIGTASISSNTSSVDATPATTSMYVGSIFVPMNMTIKGIQYLNGTTPPSTQKVVVALYNQAGTLVANSLQAGTTMQAFASKTHRVAFTGTYSAVGPAYYFIGVTYNTATPNLSSLIRANSDAGSGVVGAEVTSLVFGTLPSTITPPTTFPAAAAVPVASIWGD